MPKRKLKAKREPKAVLRGFSESEKKISKLLSKIDLSKKPWEQTGLNDDELELLIDKLTPIKRFEKQTWVVVNNLRKKNQTIWRTFLYGMLISYVLERELSALDAFWPEWKDEYISKRVRKLLEDLGAGRLVLEYDKSRDRSRTAVYPQFNWLEPHTIGEYAKAVAVNIKTIERFLKSIKATPSTPARGPSGQQYSPTVGLEIFNAWLTNPRWLTFNKLKKSFPGNNKKNNITQPSEADLRCQLGVMLFERLYYGDEDEKLKEKFRSIIHAKLSGSKEAWLKDLEHIKESSKSFWDRPILNKISDISPIN